MIKFLNKRFFSDIFPPIIIHIYYFLISLTLSYIYYHKFISRADFDSIESTGGINAVANFIAIKPIQFRIFIPFVFKAIKYIIPLQDKILFFLITIIFAYLILLAFYYLLNEYFESKTLNLWISPVIIYPMLWNLVIMNGQFFYMDFSAFFIIVLGFYFIVSEKFNLLLAVVFIGILNHPSAGYLIPAYLFYRYRQLNKAKTWIYIIIMSLMYIAYYRLMDHIFADREGYFIVNNIARNLNLGNELPFHIIIRDILLNFGCLHFAVIIFFITGTWKKYISPMLAINFVIVPYVISVLVSFSIEEIRNYSAIIPFITILTLIYLSSFPNSFLRPVNRLQSKKKDIN